MPEKLELPYINGTGLDFQELKIQNWFLSVNKLSIDPSALYRLSVR
jgi:hypothetical protein